MYNMKYLRAWTQPLHYRKTGAVLGEARHIKLAINQIEESLPEIYKVVYIFLIKLILERSALKTTLLKYGKRISIKSFYVSKDA